MLEKRQGGEGQQMEIVVGGWVGNSGGVVVYSVVALILEKSKVVD